MCKRVQSCDGWSEERAPGPRIPFASLCRTLARHWEGPALFTGDLFGAIWAPRVRRRVLATPRRSFREEPSSRIQETRYGGRNVPPKVYRGPPPGPFFSLLCRCRAVWSRADCATRTVLEINVDLAPGCRPHLRCRSTPAWRRVSRHSVTHVEVRGVPCHQNEIPHQHRGQASSGITYDVAV